MLRSERSGSASAQEGGERRRDKPGGQPVIKAVPTFVLAGTLQVLLAFTAKTKYQNFETNIPRKGISGSQSQFPLSCLCERFRYSFGLVDEGAIGQPR